MSGEQNPNPSNTVANPPTPPPVPPNNQNVLPHPQLESRQQHQNPAGNPPANVTRLVEWLQLGANVVLTIIGVWAICIYGGQLAEMRRQNILTRQQMKGIDAAIVQFVIGGIGSDGLHVGVENRGHWIATDFERSLEIKRESMPSHKAIGMPYHCDIRIPQVPPGDFPEADHLCNLPKISPQEWENLQRTTETETLSVVARYSYDDGFGDKIDKSFCKYLFSHPPYIQKNRTNVGSSVSFIDCDAYDAAILSYLINKKPN